MMVRPEDGAAQPGGEKVETLSDDHDSNPTIHAVGSGLALLQCKNLACEACALLTR
jgi:hypothetical protein